MMQNNQYPSQQSYIPSSTQGLSTQQQQYGQSYLPTNQQQPPFQPQTQFTNHQFNNQTIDIQQQQMIQNASQIPIGGLATAMANQITPTENKIRAFANYTEDLSSFTEAQNLIYTDQLKSDFQEVIYMNITDDDSLDYLYMKQDIITYPNAFLELIYNRYKEKYEQLIERNPGMSWWLYGGLAYMLHQSYSSFKERCKTTTGSITPKISGKRSRIPFKHAINVKKSKTTTEPKVEIHHPYTKLDHFIQHNYLYNFGKTAEFCVPIDFAGLFMEVTKGLVNKRAKGCDDKRLFNGLNCKFTRKFLAFMCSVSIKTDVYHNIQNAENITNIIQKMTGCNLDTHPFRLSTLKAQHTFDIISSEYNSFQNSKIYNGEDVLIALVSHMTGAYSNTNHFTFGTFVGENLIYMPTNQLSTPNSIIAIIKEHNNKNRNTRKHVIYLYKKSIADRDGVECTMDDDKYPDDYDSDDDLDDN